jgi:hypothetical protein
MPMQNWIEWQTVRIESIDTNFEGLSLLFAFEALSACLTKVSGRA